MHSGTVGEAPFGRALIVDAVTAEPRALRRLAELGLRPGARVTVLRRTAGDGRIVAVAGARVALDAATAAGIDLIEVAA